jgi:hypothetical protein
MGFLLLVGLVITIIVWTQVSWVWGLVTGFLLVGGLGWQMLASGAGLIARRRNPGVDEFTRAWEEKAGEMRFGQPGTYPPPGAYQAWREAHEREGISAGDWLDRAAAWMTAPKARGLVSGLFETIGQWEGVASAHPEGVLVSGEHVWFDGGQDRREPDDTVVPWDLFTGATLSTNRLELKPPLDDLPGRYHGVRRARTGALDSAS